MKKNILTLLCGLLLTSHCFAKSPLRIQDLLPDNLLVTLAIEPAVPENFVAMNPRGPLDGYEWTYWGPKEVLEEYFKNPESLSEPIIRVKLANSTQEEMENPDREVWRQICDESKQTFTDASFKWGNYPVYTVNIISPDSVMAIAFVGLNDPGNWVMMFNLVSPKKFDDTLWKNFLSKTEEIKGQAYLHACGQSLEDGCTIFDYGGAKMKLIAEKSEAERKLQIAIMPQQEGFSFELINVRYGEFEGNPAASVRGVITKNDGSDHLVAEPSIVVLIKEVSEFTINRDSADPHIVFHEEKID